MTKPIITERKLVGFTDEDLEVITAYGRKAGLPFTKAMRQLIHFGANWDKCFEPQPSADGTELLAPLYESPLPEKVSGPTDEEFIAKGYKQDDEGVWYMPTL